MYLILRCTGIFKGEGIFKVYFCVLSVSYSEIYRYQNIVYVTGWLYQYCIGSYFGFIEQVLIVVLQVA